MPDLTSKFKERLQENLAREERVKAKKKPQSKVTNDDDDWETIEDSDSDWETVEEPDLSRQAAQLEATKPEESTIWKGVRFLNEPLTDFGPQRTEALKKIPFKPEGRFKHTGGKDKLADFLAEASAAMEGFGRGAWEGTGYAADMASVPGNVISLAGGALANKLAQIPGYLRSAKNISNVVRGVEATGVPHGLSTAMNPEESVMNRIFGGIQAVGSAAGARYGNLPEPKAKPTPKAKTDPTAGFIDLPLNKPKAPAEEGSIGPTQLDDLDTPPTVPIKSEAIPVAAERPLQRASQEDLDSLLYNENPKVQEDAAAELAARSGQKLPTAKAQPTETPTAPVKETPEQMTARMFPGMKAKGKLDIGIQESSLAPKETPKAAPDRAGLEARIDELANKAALSPEEAVEYDQIVDALNPPEPSLREKAKNFMTSESGEVDINALFNKYQRRKLEKSKPKVLEPEVLPAEDVQLARGEGIEQVEPQMKMAQALPSGRDVAKAELDLFQGTNAAPRSKFRNFLADESGEFNPEFWKEPGQSEFSPDLMQQADEAFGGTSPRFMERIPKRTDPASVRMAELEPKIKSATANFKEISEYMRLQDAAETIPRPAPEPVPGESLFSSRLRETLFDETGAVPRKPKAENVWANLPDRVKATFKQMGIRPKDIEGMSLKDVNDTYESAVRETGGVEPDIAPDLAGETQIQPPKLIKKSGERTAPLDEDAQIARLTEKAMQAVEREKRVLRDAGQMEMSPEQLDTFRNQMQSGERFAEGVAEEADRSGIPLLRSKDYIPGPSLESKKSAARREAGYFGKSLGENLPEVKPEGFAQKTKRFLKDESGEIRFGGDEEEIPEIPPQFNDPLVQEGATRPDLPIQERPIPKEETPGMARQLIDLPLGAMSVDLPFISSAAFRQASPLAWTKAWTESWGKAAKAYGSEEAYDMIMNQIENSKYFKPRYKPSYNAKGELTGYKEMPSLAEQAGVKLSDLKTTNREEVLRSTLAEKALPWGNLIKRSNRAYSAFLNYARQQTFEKLMAEAKWAGNENDMTTVKGFADFVNDATGRGSLKFEGPGGKQLNLERSSPFVRNALWSPRLLASRLKFLNPYTYINAPDQVRQQYINGLMRSAGTWLAFAGMAKMGGAQVSTDPTNADFGKIRIGDTRIDPGAGFQQLLVLAAREAPKAVGEQMGFPTGRYTSSTTGQSQEYGKGFRAKDRVSVFEDFAASKLHPTYRLAYDLMRASSERPVHLGDRAVQLAMPIMAQDIMEAAKVNPELAALLGPLSSAGLGTATYGRGDRLNDPVFTDSIESALGQQPGSLRGTITKW